MFPFYLLSGDYDTVCASILIQLNIFAYKKKLTCLIQVLKKHSWI